jgi:2-phospho-L-lactate guanylyltransferase
MTQARGDQIARRIWAAVAFKGPTGGKRRLAGLLSPDERAALGHAMLEDVLDTLIAVPAIETIVLIAPDGRLPDRLLRDRIRHVSDVGSGTPGDGLNSAFELAQLVASEASVNALLLMPADLPTLGATDLNALAQAGRSAGIVIAPDRAEGGTNALLLTPPTIIRPAFGEGSFARHRRLAIQEQVEPVVVRRPALALDVDVPADVAALLDSDIDCRARRLLIEIGVEARLDALASDQARSATI